MDYNDIVGNFYYTKKKEKYYVESYEGLNNKAHMYCIRFIQSAKVKLANRSSIVSGKVTSSIRKKKPIKTTREGSRSVDSRDISGFNLRLMAVDASTSNTGYSCFNMTRLLEIDKISSKHNSINFRIREMCKVLEEKIIQHSINYVALEDIFFEKGKFKAFQGLCLLQGAIIDMLIRNNVKYILISPSMWKAKMGTLTNRSDSKSLAIEKVENQIGRRLTDDEAESFLIGIYVLDNRVNWLA